MQGNEQRRILIVDDEPGLRDLLRINLEHEGFSVIEAESGAQGLQMVRDQHPDLMILDVMMPEMDGWEVCRRLREFSQMPVLMLTARTQSKDIVTGLESGADDYLTKPFNMDELTARIRALLRRVPSPNRPIVAGGGEIMIDKQKREVLVRGEPVDLTPTEYDLLLLLAEHAGAVLDHETLLRGVWGHEYTKDNDYLKVYIWHLRRKIEQDPREPKLLLTEWGVGYRLAP
ncbi:MULTISPECIES: response regulator transcription factor [Roseiflexus]|uniref:Two component transcriptional regulator, winged helix family n=1 Tax=Roseiflexus castenholzii (strain DSM 13941 / HLO8) TaxID=383372 RepID=A7NSB5_ROSCS|nr:MULTISPECIES: response regulator transcription factor [Roseiflexus]ABU60461.1 two component transcriptional regulator, winged helix family [Roseiflexus castenholzii DSM 13941]PMP73915.1 MAG: DNA-binding response regulator [Roseiflexus castenholzii]GIV98880.1 MAG: DNA-binding response regulator [Roseiflexus sp.]